MQIENIRPRRKYEVRFNEGAVDVQIKTKPMYRNQLPN